MSTVPQPALQTDTTLPKVLPPLDCTQMLFDMLDAGCTFDEVAAEFLYCLRVTNKAVRPSQAKIRLENILLNKWRYCPDIDHVAVERAYDGDKDAWVALTHYERTIVIERLYKTWQTKPHRMWPDDEHGRGIGEWARSVGESSERITSLRRGPNGQRRRG